MVALHATDPATIYLAVVARGAGLAVADVDDALFERRTMLRTLAMRRTLFLPTTDTIPIVERSSSGDVAAKERKALVGFLHNTGIEQPERWLAAAFELVLEALDGRSLQARQITDAVPVLGTRIILGTGKFTQEAKATSRVLGLMAVEGLLARGRPAGGWTNRQYAWTRRDQWFPLPDDPPSVDDASAELVRRYVERFGPVTLTDIVWWTGWTKTKTRSAMAGLDLAEVELDGGTTGYVLADDIHAVDAPDPWVALLPSLDPTAVGWKERDWYVGPHVSELFDRNGNIGPTIWADGRIVGVWAQHDDGGLRTHLLELVSAHYSALIGTELERLAAFIGPASVKPSFPTPRQKLLAAS